VRRPLVLAVVAFSSLIGVIVLAVSLARPVLQGGGRAGGGPSLGDPSRSGPILDKPTPGPSHPSRPGTPSTPPRLPASLAEVVGTFPRGLSALKARLGRHAQLTMVNVNQVSVLFSYRRGRSDRAGVLQWRPERLALEPADPRFAGPFSATQPAFPIGVVRPRVPASLVGRLRRRAPRGEVVAVQLFRLPVSRDLTWQAIVRAGGRYLTYRAASDGSRLRELR
jgi:hypothetical protein